MIAFAPRSWIVALGLAGVMALGACTKATEVTTVDQVHANVGQACLDVPAAGAAPAVEVSFGLCLSSSCDELVNGSCTATLAGNVLTVESTATVRSQRGPNVVCTSDCGSVTARCETPALPAGAYSLVYAGQRVELTLPVTASTCARASQ